jgi:hypothetical protein
LNIQVTILLWAEYTLTILGLISMIIAALQAQGYRCF